MSYTEPKQHVSDRNIQKAKVILETMRASSSVNSTPRSGISNTSSVPNWMPSTYEFRLLNFEFPPQCSPATLVDLRMKNLTLRSSYPGTFAQLSLEEQINEKFASVGERVRSYLDAVLSKHPPSPLLFCYSKGSSLVSGVFRQPGGPFNSSLHNRVCHGGAPRLHLLAEFGHPRGPDPKAQGDFILDKEYEKDQVEGAKR